jgi:DNA helicase-2/ATP-dependent DNA helicase PcrA
MLANSGASDPTRLLDVVVTAREADFWDPRADRVSLLTLHAAKGLEFPVVFVVGLEDGILPLYWDTIEPASAEEERRLFYVGMTRANDRLVLSRAGKRLWRGKMRTLDPSPVLADIEKELVRHQLAEAAPRPDHRQLKLF